jgi:hypothetical protein
MRCHDLTREIASPTGAYSSADLAGHIAACPSCAEWSRQAARFDQIWEATRPAEPTTAQLDALWASASARLDARPTLRLEGLATAPRRTWVRPALIVAQAAAILVAAGLLLPRQPAVAPVEVAANAPVQDMATLDFATVPRIVVNDGEIAFVKIPDDAKAPPEVKFEVETVSDGSNAIPPGTSHDGFNEMEIKGVKVVGL